MDSPNGCGPPGREFDGWWRVRGEGAMDRATQKYPRSSAFNRRQSVSGATGNLRCPPLVVLHPCYGPRVQLDQQPGRKSDRAAGVRMATDLLPPGTEHGRRRTPDRGPRPERLIRSPTDERRLHPPPWTCRVRPVRLMARQSPLQTGRRQCSRPVICEVPWRSSHSGQSRNRCRRRRMPLFRQLCSHRGHRRV